MIAQNHDLFGAELVRTGKKIESVLMGPIFIMIRGGIHNNKGINL